ncbi:alcohol acetyltransferase [Xylaria cubensis]|nr:alcohol acetyltransferase [Xylaria cubensis]
MIQLRFLGSTIVNSRYTIPPSLAAPEHHDRIVAWVENAIARVILEHPALRLDVVNADTKRPTWVAVDELDFTHHITWEDINDTAGNYEETLRTKIEKRLDEPYTNLTGRPQWRVLILFKKGVHHPSLDIVFDYSHAFSDGTSGKIFHETLLRTLNTTTTDGEQNHVLTNRVLKIPPSATPLPPPVEKLGKFSVTAKFAISTAWRELRPAGLIASPPAAHAHWAPIQPTPYATQFRTFDIEAAVLRNILTACRAHKTTVTGLLHALILASMAARIKESDAIAFTGSTALDLRRFLGQTAPKGLEPSRTMADYVSQTAHVFDADLVREIRAAAATVSGKDAPPSQPLVDLVWRCATLVRSEIQKRLDSGLKNDLVGLMRLVSDWRAQFRTEASKPRPYSFVVTNLGVLDGGSLDTTTAADVAKDEEEKDRGWTIEHAVFAISAEVCGAAFQVSPISVKNGALCVSCGWQECVVDAELGEGIVADLARWLRFLGES